MFLSGRYCRTDGNSGVVIQKTLPTKQARSAAIGVIQPRIASVAIAKPQTGRAMSRYVFYRETFVCSYAEMR
jgi:hypothetical protein